jgi:hypothetical protein
MDRKISFSAAGSGTMRTVQIDNTVHRVEAKNAMALRRVRNVLQTPSVIPSLDMVIGILVWKDLLGRINLDRLDQALEGLPGQSMKERVMIQPITTFVEYQ